MYYNIVTPEDIPINGLIDALGFGGIVGFTIIADLVILKLINYLENWKKSDALIIVNRFVSLFRWNIKINNHTVFDRMIISKTRSKFYYI